MSRFLHELMEEFLEIFDLCIDNKSAIKSAEIQYFTDERNTLKFATILFEIAWRRAR